MWNDIGWFAATKDVEMQNDIGWRATAKGVEVWNDKGKLMLPIFFNNEVLVDFEILFFILYEKFLFYMS